jgi:hypothetical protein
VVQPPKKQKNKKTKNKRRIGREKSPEAFRVVACEVDTCGRISEKQVCGCSVVLVAMSSM